MSYAIRIDGQGWRAVSCEADLLVGEVFAANLDGFTPAAPSKDQRIAALLAVRGLTLDSEWQLYAAIAGMQAAASTQGKTEAQLYASNPGYKNAKDLFIAVATERAKP